MSLTSGDPAITEYIVATGILTGPHFLWDTLMDQLIFLNLVSITSIKYYISRRMYLHFYKRFFSLDEGIIVGISDMVADQSEAFFFFLLEWKRDLPVPFQSDTMIGCLSQIKDQSLLPKDE